MTDSAPAGSYWQVMRHPVAGRLSAATLISSLGDFIALGVLLLVMYERAGQRALGPAVVFGVQAVPALAVGTVGSNVLERLDPRPVLVGAQLLGAAAILLVLVTSTALPVLVAAAALGLSRAVTTPLRSAAVASDVPEQLRSPAISLGHSFFQIAQVVGFMLGSTATVAGTPEAALLFDIATFGVAALLFHRMPLSARAVAARPRRAVGEGMRVIFADPVARLVVPATWTALFVGALPEAMTPALVEGFWIGPSLVAAALVTALGALALGRTKWIEQVDTTLRLALVVPASLLLTGVAASSGANDWAIVAAHALMGVAGLVVVSAQAVLTRTMSRDDIVHLSAAMSAALIVLEGIGAVFVGLLLDALDPLAAYCAVSVAAAVPILWALRRAHRGRRSTPSAGPSVVA